MRYKKKPVVIEAKQWDGTARAATPIIDWILDEGGTARLQYPDPGDPDCVNRDHHSVFVYCPTCSYTSEQPVISINTLEGTMAASPGDFVIRGVAGEFYPCKPDIFEATYSPALHEDR